MLRFLRRGLPPQGLHTVLILVAIAVGLVCLRLLGTSSARGGDLVLGSGGTSLTASFDTSATSGGDLAAEPLGRAGSTGEGSLSAASAPMRLVIPTIGVSSGLLRLGMNADRTVQVPSSFGTAGWYTGSAVPGDAGRPAVILGHVDSRSGPAVFYRLKALRPGDDVWVQRSDGTWIRFTVNRVGEFPKTDFPTRLVYAPQPGTTLRLVTCGGRFDPSTGHYVDNIVVFATLA